MGRMVSSVCLAQIVSPLPAPGPAEVVAVPSLALIRDPYGQVLLRYSPASFHCSPGTAQGSHPEGAWLCAITVPSCSITFAQNTFTSLRLISALLPWPQFRHPFSHYTVCNIVNVQGWGHVMFIYRSPEPGIQQVLSVSIGRRRGLTDGWVYLNYPTCIGWKKGHVGAINEWTLGNDVSCLSLSWPKSGPGV